MKNRNYSFEIRRDNDLTYELNIPQNWLDHLLIPIYGLICFIVSLVLYPAYLIIFWKNRNDA